MTDLSRRRFLQLTAGVGLVSTLPALRSAALASGPPKDGLWLAGDFHVHTTYSHDVWGGPGDDNTAEDEFYTLGWTPGEQITIAETRGLDFVALTDHNRVDALRDPGYRSTHLTLVPGYEHSLGGGHAGVFMPGIDALPDVVKAPDGSTNFDANAPLFTDLVHERGGITVINHPKDKKGWGYSIESSLGFDAIEGWNGRWQQRSDVFRDPLPSVWNNSHETVPWWEQSFIGDHQRRIGITGGSDNHWRAVTAVAGVGQPTTWVYAADRSAASIIDGVRNGRTFVAQEPPAHLGPRLFLTATEAWRTGRDAMIGGAVKAEGPVEVAVKVENAAGHRLRLISTGQVVKEWQTTLPIATYEHRVVLPQNGWVRAELLYDPGYAMYAVTSPIFAVGQAPSFARAGVTTGPAVSYASPPTTLPEITCDC